MDSLFETIGFLALMVFLWLILDPESLGKSLNTVMEQIK